MALVTALAFKLAAGGGAVMEAGLFLKRDASDAIAGVRIIHVWKRILIPDELRMMRVVDVKFVTSSGEKWYLL